MTIAVLKGMRSVVILQVFIVLLIINLLIHVHVLVEGLGVCSGPPPATGKISFSTSVSAQAASADDCAEAKTLSQLLSLIITYYMIVNIIKSRAHVIISP